MAIGFFETEARENRRDSAFALITSAVGELSADAVVAFRQRARNLSMGIAEVGHLLLEVPHFDFEVVEPGEGLRRLLLHAVFETRVDFLTQHSDTNATGPQDLSAVARLVSGQHAQQGRFAGTVGTDEADAISRVQAQTGVLEERASADLFGDVLESNQHERWSSLSAVDRQRWIVARARVPRCVP